MFVWLLGENFGTVYPTGEVFIQQTLLNYSSTHIAMCEWMIFKKYKFIYFGLTQFALSIGWHFFVFTYWRPWVLCAGRKRTGGYFLTRIQRLKSGGLLLTEQCFIARCRIFLFTNFLLISGNFSKSFSKKHSSPDNKIPTAFLLVILASLIKSSFGIIPDLQPTAMFPRF